MRSAAANHAETAGSSTSVKITRRAAVSTSGVEQVCQQSLDTSSPAHVVLGLGGSPSSTLCPAAVQARPSSTIVSVLNTTRSPGSAAVFSRRRLGR